MLVVNLLGEPGVGKSTTASGVFYELSVNGFRSEIIPEVAKGYAWETPKDNNGKSLIHPIFGQQIFLLGEQNRYLERVIGQRDIAIMECPLIMTAIYKPEGYLESFDQLALEQFNVYNNINIVLERNHVFDPEGRVHDEQGALEVRNKLMKFLNDNKIPYVVIPTHRDVSKSIVKYIQENYFPNQELSKEYDDIKINNK
jgi:hypothetical protein